MILFVISWLHNIKKNDLVIFALWRCIIKCSFYFSIEAEFKDSYPYTDKGYVNSR